MTASASLLRLSSPVLDIQGIGIKRAVALKAAGLETVRDVLYHIPRRYVDRSTIFPIVLLPVESEVTAVGEVERVDIWPSRKEGGKARFVLTIRDETGVLQGVWFHGFNYLRRLFTPGDTVALSGKVEIFGGKQMVHPEVEHLSARGEEGLLHTGRIIPLYPSTADLKAVRLDSRGFRRLVRDVLDQMLPQLRDPLPEGIRTRWDLLSLPEALSSVHFPGSLDEAEAGRRRLAFDEFFEMELRLARRRHRRMTTVQGIVFLRVGDLVARLLRQLPFELTDAQKRVMHEIRADMKRPVPMNRLLQGDVGSGKTLVALMTMLIAVENGTQAAFMAPTEILAEQHFLTVHRLLNGLGVRVVFLVSGLRKPDRDRALQAIADGSAEIVIGTHALIQEGVDFHKLGLVIIDEQHRFGVMQRMALRSKGVQPDVLVMTATPIPRTLSLTLYGDLDVSVLDEMPPGRQPIKTGWRPASKRRDALTFLRDQVRQGRQAYIVYPLVEESEQSDLNAATESYERLRTHELKGLQLALLHGRMSNEEKEEVMRGFKAGEIDVLVSTTVIEVGVDVPNATVMLVEHAERFGLSQLHQLRGRVGRGVHPSYCILLTTEAFSDEARMRLEAMKRTCDGFQIAEEDLRLRGPGEFFGTRQSGLPELRIAHLVRDADLLTAARDEAFSLIEDDPQLGKPEHERLRANRE